MTRKFRLVVAILATMAATLAGATTKGNNAKNTAADAKPATEISNNDSQRTVFATTSNGHKVKYVYGADAKGRVSTKVGYVLDKDTNKWQPICAYSICYTDAETILSYAEYDSMKKTFTHKPQQVRFDAKAYPELMKMPE